jgi:PAS domain S-box-containing protein
MTETTRVNFHIHSDLSDGAYSPETLASMLARDGVRFAALSDHDCVEGVERFQEAMRPHRTECITGVEISTSWRGIELHILAYGFDEGDSDFRQTLHAIRKQRRIGFQTVIESLRTTLQGASGDIAEELESAHQDTKTLPPFGAEAIIQRVHDVGGLAFLAHPWVLSKDENEVIRIVDELREAGLDGVEAYGPECPSSLREQFEKKGRTEELLLCGGTDLHTPDGNGRAPTGVEMPTREWKRFRDALRRAPAKSEPDAAEIASWLSSSLRWRELALRFALPALLTLALFLLANFVLIIPMLEDRLLQREHENARELTATVVSLLDEYAREEANGEMTREEAQQHAVARIRDLRYGPEGKDYFWIIDRSPSMVMHPYRRDLDGTDLSSYVDERGKELFVESVKAVEDDGEGFVEYWWQWQDDPSRIEAKDSHVRLFEPWDWIVGTGLYVEDVQTEIAVLSQRLVWTSIFIAAIVASLLLFMVQQSLRLENQRGRAQSALQESHEKYRMLVETAVEGTILLLDGKCAFANRAMLGMLDYAPSEFRLLDWHDLMPESDRHGAETVLFFSDLIEGRPAPTELKGRLRRKDGSSIALEITCRIASDGDRSTLIVTARKSDESTGRPIARSSHAERDNTAILEDLHSSLLFLNEPVGRFPKSNLLCSIETPIAETSRLMTRNNVNAALICSESGRPLGIVTDQDLRIRVLSQGFDLRRPIREVMTSPLHFVSEEALAHEALLSMERFGVRHLAVRNTDGKTTGLIAQENLLAFHRYASSVLGGEIERAATLETIIEVRERIPRVVASLVEASAKPRSVMRLLASVHDATTDRLLRLAMDELGTPPVRFAFICMGSQGRREETLITDQDNGIIYENVEPERLEETQAYFEKLASLVCRWLDAAGYCFCRGGVMANSLEWRDSLDGWRDRFSRWITASEPEDILRFDMCFDFRCVYGADELAYELKQSVFLEIARRPEFLAHFARNALQYKPPLNFFGKILSSSSGDRRKTFDAKDAMMSIVKFARIYSLRENCSSVNTGERLDRMMQQGILSAGDHDETAMAYECLAKLRLDAQVQALQENRPLDNEVALGSISHIEAATLKESLLQIATIQKRISFDFFGTSE